MYTHTNAHGIYTLIAQVCTCMPIYPPPANVAYANNLFCPWNNNTVCPSKKLVCVVPGDSSLPGLRLSLIRVQWHWNTLWLAFSWDSPILYLAQKTGKGDSGDRITPNTSQPIGIQHPFPQRLPLVLLRIPGEPQVGGQLF